MHGKLGALVLALALTGCIQGHYTQSAAGGYQAQIHRRTCRRQGR